MIENKYTWKHLIGAFAVGFILLPILYVITMWAIVEPIVASSSPTVVRICPAPYPQIHDGKQWIHVQITNDGLSEINPLVVEYNMIYYTNGDERANIQKTILKKEESAYFEFPVNVNESCSPTVGPLVVDFYEDSNGVCYSKIENSTKVVCVSQRLNVTVYEGSTLIGNISYPYPFFEDAVTFSAEVTKGCLDYDSAPDKDALTYVAEKQIKLAATDPYIGCLTRDLSDATCKKLGLDISTCERY